MKKLLFSLAFIAATLTSCLTDKPGLNYEGKDAVNFTIGIDVPELATRAGETGMNSGLGAIDNFSADEWAMYDLRYMLEVYDVTEGYENLERPVKQRMVQTFDEYQETKFELRLIPNRTYKFVVWADFVAQGSEEDLNYNTANLANITRTGYVSPMDECMDAYFVQEDILVTESLAKSLTLTRPFGKIRVIATDIDEVNIGTTATKVDVTFYNHPTFTALNALSGKTQTTVEEVTYSYTISKDAPYTDGYDSEAKNQTLFADYIFAQAEGAQEVNFTMTVTDQMDRTIREHDFNTQIPLKRNHLTTIMGNLLTTATEFNVSIDDNFDGEYTINPEATQLAAPVVTATAIENVVTLSWESVENADYYVVSYNDNSTTTTQTAATYTLDYATEYTFSVVACANDTMAFCASEAATATVTTEQNTVQLATPVVSGEIENYKSVKLSWTKDDNAASYSIVLNNDTYTTEESSYTFDLAYATEYTFYVTAVAAEDNALYTNSEAAEFTITTAADPYIYLKPNSNWTIDNARFAVYTWIDGGSSNWISMEDSDKDGIYEVLKSKLNNNIIFCRMNPATSANNWNNKWNQTADLTLPNNGNNMYSIANGSWDNGAGTWSKK